MVRGCWQESRIAVKSTTYCHPKSGDEDGNLVVEMTGATKSARGHLVVHALYRNLLAVDRCNFPFAINAAKTSASPKPLCRFLAIG